MNTELIINQIKQSILDSEVETDMSKELHILIREYNINKLIDDSKDESVAQIIEYLYNAFSDRLFDGDCANYWDEPEEL